ncbi:MAG: hypothetical protein LPK85_03395, partial [Gammaproteobacteria bacterium]|nr:hypothetical protein [Gammaproteobacteria bacterium]
MRRRARHYLSSLRGRGVLLVSLVTVIAVVVSSAVGLWRGRALLEEQTLRHLGNVAVVAALDLDERLQTRF